MNAYPFKFELEGKVFRKKQIALNKDQIEKQLNKDCAEKQASMVAHWYAICFRI